MQDELVKEDPRSKEILKPILRGRDIARYRANWAGLWLIDTHNGWSGVSPINIDKYPAVKAHLNRYIGQLAQRRDKGITPYNLRNCAYHELFKEPKVLWKDMTQKGAFAYSDTEIFTNDKAYLMTGKHLQYLCAALNCSVISWLMAKIGLTTPWGLIQWKKFTVEDLPIVRPDENTLRLINEKITEMNILMAAGRPEHVLEIQVEIDDNIRTLYGISDQEMKALHNVTMCL